jgi:hypothetical protein
VHSSNKHRVAAVDAHNPLIAEIVWILDGYRKIARIRSEVLGGMTLGGCAE